jgi:putative endonuclease
MDGTFCYVYMLQSVNHPEHWYVGLTHDLHERLQYHNAGKVSHTSKYLPWRIETAVAFRHKTKALAFEEYLKSQSGRAFAKKHF